MFVELKLNLLEPLFNEAKYDFTVFPILLHYWPRRGCDSWTVFSFIMKFQVLRQISYIIPMEFFVATIRLIYSMQHFWYEMNR
ncbi:hypothetical protein T05_14879 [Trichinella murrelli]|uniref:Uncharacterized protein n=1 Tax=Trichinella murrelli TaxID=144512 RepID=A0A0V0U6Z8_9BILA|nr:hypothetical protein T05_14879 [Trichinella murrelli]